MTSPVYYLSEFGVHGRLFWLFDKPSIKFYRSVTVSCLRSIARLVFAPNGNNWPLSCANCARGNELLDCAWLSNIAMKFWLKLIGLNWVGEHDSWIHPSYFHFQSIAFLSIKMMCVSDTHQACLFPIFCWVALPLNQHFPFDCSLGLSYFLSISPCYLFLSNLTSFD